MKKIYRSEPQIRFISIQPEQVIAASGNNGLKGVNNGNTIIGNGGLGSGMSANAKNRILWD